MVMCFNIYWPTLRSYPFHNKNLTVTKTFYYPYYRPVVKYFKEAYSNLCMKIHLTSKLTQYLTNLFKMRFLMRNSIKYVQQSQNGIFEKRVGQQRYPNQLYGSPPLYNVNIEI